MHTSSRFVHDRALPMRGRPGECFQGLAKREVALAIALSLLWIIFMFSLGLDLPPKDLARVVCQPEALAIGAFNQMRCSIGCICAGDVLRATRRHPLT